MELIFLDTEFSSLDWLPELVSIGLVAENGDFFYAELPEETWESKASLFVLDEVKPHLWGGEFIIDPVVLSQRLTAWFAVRGHCRVVTDAPNYDFRLMQEVLRKHWPVNLHPEPFCFDMDVIALVREGTGVICEAARAGHYETNPQHHALEDAKALCLGWKAMEASGLITRQLLIELTQR